MAQTQEQVGRALVVLAVVLAALVVVWLYRWEQSARTAEAVPPAEAGEAASPQISAGRQAFQQLCDSCHPGGGAGLGPSLLELDQEPFVEVTREGVGAMPAYTTSRLSDQKLEAMYAYLQGLAGGAAPTPSAAGPPAIPHTLEGRDLCLGCHGSGSTAFPQVPADHAGRTVDTCTLCHSPTGTPTPAPTATPAPAATATPTPTAAPSGPPAIPHTLEGRDLCLGCHGSGSTAFPQVPADHAGRANEACTLCHSPTGTPTPAPTATPTPTPAATATPTPTAAPTGPPAIPHPLEGRDQCLGCHGSGSTAFPQVPAGHAGRTEDTCTLCHSPEG